MFDRMTFSIVSFLFDFGCFRIFVSPFFLAFCFVVVEAFALSDDANIIYLSGAC